MYVFAQPPNWKQSFEAVLRFQTNILYSRSGKEQRIAKRFEPRIGFEFQVLAKRDRFIHLQREVYQNLQSQIVCPFWPDRQELAIPAGIGATSVGVSEVRPWMKVGSLLVVAQHGQGEAHVISGVSGTTVVLETALSSSWAVGSSVVEGFKGLLDPDFSQRGYTDELSALDVQFQVEPGTAPVHDTGVVGTVFDGLEVFEVPVNWANALQTEVKDPRSIVDFGYGVREVFRPQEFLTLTKRFSMLEDDFASIRGIEDFFRRQRGQQKEFYFPNPQRDLRAVSGLNIGQQTITVEGSEFAEFFTDETVHRAISINTPSGPIYNQIENAVASGGNTVLYVRNAWTATVSLADVGRISILNVTRFASDALTVEWKTNSVATVRGAIQSLEDHWSAA